VGVGGWSQIRDARLELANVQMETPACQGMSFEERLGLLVDRELTLRDDKRLLNRLRMAKLRLNACVEDIDYRAARGLDKTLLRSLAAESACPP